MCYVLMYFTDDNSAQQLSLSGSNTNMRFSLYERRNQGSQESTDDVMCSYSNDLVISVIRTHIVESCAYICMDRASTLHHISSDMCVGFIYDNYLSICHLLSDIQFTKRYNNSMHCYISVY